MSRSSVASKPSSAASNGLHGRPPAALVARLLALSELPFVKALGLTIPWSLIGLVVALPVLLFAHGLLGPWWGVGLGRRVAAAVVPAFSVMAAMLVPLLAWRFAQLAGYNRFALTGASLVGFALALPRPLSGDPVIYMRALGTSALFLAMLVCGVVAFAAFLARRAGWKGAEWIGGAVAVATIASLPLLHVSLPALVTQSVEPLARLGDSYPALIAIVLIETLLWTAGIHGPAVLAGLVLPVYLSLQTQNTDAFAAHRPLPHIVVVSLFLFVFPGGAGATLPLAALLACSRVRRLRRVGRLTILPALFNANEPLLFGLPVVFNPLLAIPFVLAPVVLATVTYVTFALGWVARPAFYVPSSLPLPISTYLATIDPRAIVLALVNVAIATAIYLPFVRAYERHEEASA